MDVCDLAVVAEERLSSDGVRRPAGWRAGVRHIVGGAICRSAVEARQESALDRIDREGRMVMFAALALDQPAGAYLACQVHAETFHYAPGRQIVTLSKRDDRGCLEDAEGKSKPGAADLRRMTLAPERLPHGPAEFQALLRPGWPDE